MSDSTKAPTTTDAPSASAFGTIRRSVNGGANAIDSTSPTLAGAAGIAGLPSDIVPLDQIIADFSYQRELQPHRWMLTRCWDDRLCNDVILAKRPGTQLYYVIDGHHRVYGARELGYHSIHAKIIDVSGPAEEAHLFDRFNSTSKKLSPLQTYQSRYASFEEITRAAEKVLRDYRLTALTNTKGAPDLQDLGLDARVVAVSAIRSAWGASVPDSVLGHNSWIKRQELNQGADRLDFVVRSGDDLRTHSREKASIVYSGYFFGAMLWIRMNVANRDELDAAEIAKVLVKAGSGAELNAIITGTTGSSQNAGSRVKQGLRLVQFINKHSTAASPLIRLTEEQAIKSAEMFNQTVYLRSGEQVVTRNAA
jgi:hypothetical protein